MALVAYDYDSNDSEHDDEEPEDKTNSGNVILNKQEQLNVGDNIKVGAFVSNGHSTNINDKTNENETNSISSSMFATLPKTHGTDNKNVIHEDKIEDFIPKVNKVKEKQKVKITIPSLSQFEGHEDDLPKKQKIQPSAKGSSLLSLLPPVKAAPLSNKSFIPNSVAQKSKNVPATTKSFVPHSVKKRAELKNKPSTSKPSKIAVKAATSSSDIESDDDFELPESFDDEMWQKVCGRPKPKQIIQEETYEERAEEVNIAPEAAEPYSGLDNEAFKELVGKKRGRDQNINVIDIHEEDILPEKDIWMVKSITDPEQVPKPVVENPVDPTRKRKHHITYLAEQAKANEQELANQWSASKFTRNQTRAKYGF